MMSRDGPDCRFTNAAIAAWRRRLDKFDMAEYFGRRPCSIAKGVFATRAVKKIVLGERVASINAYFNGETIDFTVQFDANGNLETSADKRKITAQIITIAALMEIIVLVNSAAADVVGKNRPQWNDKAAVVDEILPGEIADPADGGAQIRKCVLVKFSLCGSDVVMRAFLDNSEKKPIFMPSKHSVTVISGSEKKMALLRLLYYAKKANFEFCSANRDYRLKNLRLAIDLMCQKFDIWNRLFSVELAPEMLLLRRGIIFPEIRAKVSEPDPSHIAIEWIVETKYGRINQANMQDMLRANGRPVFVGEIGAVALTADQIAVIRPVFFSDPNAKLRKYMLHTLLNQRYIGIDTSACTTTRIDVGTVQFPLPDFLKNYQREGVYAMRAILDAGCHCLLADEMGLGKTLQVLALICADDEKTHSLVVCPASVVFVWQKEIGKFFPEKTFAVVDKFYNFSDRPDFLLCSYAQVHKMNRELKKLSFDYAILDEAQYAKNPRSKTMQACCNIDGRCRIAITGTPIENNVMDIWSIFRFLMPGFFCGYKQFQENIACRDFRNDFRGQIATFTIRRTKQSVAIELPKRNELELACPMNHGQKFAYDAVKNNLKSKLLNFSKIDSKTRMNVLAAITRLRQAACAQFILPEALRHDNGRESQKIDALMIKLENVAASGKKAIVFSQFLEFLKEIRARIGAVLPETAIYLLTGTTVNREAVVDDFQNAEGGAVILISLRTGGVGITLHAAEYVFLMEPWWNPAVEEQAIARIHRIGQKKITTVYRLISEGSIEERMREIQSSKNKLFNEFIKTGVDNIAMANFYLKNLDSLLE
ncbi:MAG: DEAD/DEAH box helicase [Puniceicoccales bacterium]|jgi:superfamily II DNA or RNA helicase|nr:DEAD/DEAH box helicase [Puniceicoccales bacterium]